MIEWRVIPGFPGYEASSSGAVRPANPRYRRHAVEQFIAELVGEELIRGDVLRPWVETRHGREALRVQLVVRGVRQKEFVHRLVALAFHGVPAEGQTDCCHLNHNSLDNRASNLRWDTHSANVAANFSDEYMERRAIMEEELAPELANTADVGTPF